jgi:hypothetical protein
MWPTLAIALYPYLYYIPSPLFYTYFSVVPKDILYREIHAIWLTLTSREQKQNKRKKNTTFFYIQQHTSSSKNSKKIYDKKNQNEKRKKIQLIFNRWMNCHVYLSASMEKN